jgi:hypothetical protein
MLDSLSTPCPDGPTCAERSDTSHDIIRYTELCESHYHYQLTRNRIEVVSEKLHLCLAFSPRIHRGDQRAEVSYS